MNPLLPLQGGDSPAQTSLVEDTRFKLRIFIEKEAKKLSAVVNHPLLGGAKLRNDFTINDRGGFHRTKEKLIAIINVECDDKNYKKYKSATQPKFNSSNLFGS